MNAPSRMVERPAPLVPDLIMLAIPTQMARTVLDLLADEANRAEQDVRVLRPRSSARVAAAARASGWQQLVHALHSAISDRRHGHG